MSICNHVKWTYTKHVPTKQGWPSAGVDVTGG